MNTHFLIDNLVKTNPAIKKIKRVCFVYGYVSAGKSSFINYLFNDTNVVQDQDKPSSKEIKITAETIEKRYGSRVIKIEATKECLFIPATFKIVNDNVHFIVLKTDQEIQENLENVFFMVDLPGLNSTEFPCANDIMLRTISEYKLSIMKIFVLFDCNEKIFSNVLLDLVHRFGIHNTHLFKIVLTYVDVLLQMRMEEEQWNIERTPAILSKAIFQKKNEFLQFFRSYGILNQFSDFTYLTPELRKLDIINNRVELQQIKSELWHSKSEAVQVDMVSDISFCLVEKIFATKKEAQKIIDNKNSLQEKFERDVKHTIKTSEGSLGSWKVEFKWTKDWDVMNEVVIYYHELYTYIQYISLNKAIMKEKVVDQLPSLELLQQGLLSIIKATLIDTNLFAIEEPSQLLYTKNFRKCPHCGLAWGNINACGSRRCGSSYDNSSWFTDYFKKKNKQYQYGCGETYTWDNGEPVYIFEFGKYLKISELITISFYR